MAIVVRMHDYIYEALTAIWVHDLFAEKFDVAVNAECANVPRPWLAVNPKLQLLLLGARH